MKQDISIKAIKKEAKQLINDLFEDKVEYTFYITRKLLLAVHIKSKNGKTISQVALDTFYCWLKSINTERQTRMLERVHHFVFDVVANIVVDILANIIDWL